LRGTFRYIEEVRPHARERVRDRPKRVFDRGSELHIGFFDPAES